MNINGLDLSVVKGNGRNSITLKFLNKDSAKITFPGHFSSEKINEFILSNEKWLKNAHKRFISKKKLIESNTCFFKGACYESFYLKSRIPGVQISDDKMFIFSKNPENGLKDLIKWLNKQTIDYLNEKKPIFIQYGINSVKTKNTRRRWGSCTSRGELTFNSKLICLPEHLIEYIIYHEICHLFQMNHSKRFKLTLEHFIPDYRAREKELRGYLLS